MTKETPGSAFAKLIALKTSGASDEKVKKVRKKIEEKTVQFFEKQGVKCTVVNTSSDE